MEGGTPNMNYQCKLNDILHANPSSEQFASKSVLIIYFGNRFQYEKKLREKEHTIINSFLCCGINITATCYFNPLTLRVKPWMIQSFITFDSMDKNLKCHHSLKSVVLFFNFTHFVLLEIYLFWT